MAQALATAIGTTPWAPTNDADARTRLARWFAVARVLALLAIAAVVAAAIASGRLPPPSARYLGGALGALVLFDGAVLAMGDRIVSETGLAVQVTGDTALLGFMIHHAGGPLNPFAGLFVLHAVIGGALLSPRRARLAAMAIALFVGSLALLEATALPAACIRARDGSCAAADPLLLLTSAGAIATLVVGAGNVVIALMRALGEERRRLAEVGQVLGLERAKLRSILDCMSDAVIFVLPDGRTDLRNRVAETVWPHAAGRLCHPPHKLDSFIAKVQAPGASESHPTLLRGGRSYQASYAPVHDAHGTFSGVVMVARDVTEQLHAERLRSEHERMAVVGKLATALAHEINNPLGVIALYTQLALGLTEPGGELADHLRTVQRNTELCKKVVRDLLDYARRRPPERRTLDLAPVLERVARTLAPHADRSAVAIRVERAEPGEVTVHGDGDQLQQVMVNLGLNAIDAMPSGGELVFRLSATPDGARIDVRDTGEGIAEDLLERIFAPFFTTKAQGTGLGLAVSRDVVAAHGGRIDAKSRPGTGTEFTIQLPSHGGER